MRIHSAAVPPFMKNGFLVAGGDTTEAVLIDPGDEVEALVAIAARDGLQVRAILLTHAHLDHITGVDRARRAFSAPVWLHRDDLFLYEGILEQGRMFGLDVARQPPVDCFYEDNPVLTFGSSVVEWHHTPGHCPGGVCLAIGPEGASVPELFVGDTLFAGAIGRTDLPGGSYAVLMRSIRDVLLRFPDETVVHPGHGPDTTIGRERAAHSG